MQKTLKVAIQGDRASFHEIAANALYDHPIEIIYCSTFADAFDKLVEGHADKALVATHNSTHGIIQEVATLLEHHNVHYESEYHLPIQQHLIGLPGTRLDTISQIISHPVALSQCSIFLTNTGHAETLPYYDTAAAVEYVKTTNDASIAAIASSVAAELYGLTILEHAIQDDPNNVTVFKSFSALRPTLTA